MKKILDFFFCFDAIKYLFKTVKQQLKQTDSITWPNVITQKSALTLNENEKISQNGSVRCALWVLLNSRHCFHFWCNASAQNSRINFRHAFD